MAEEHTFEQSNRPILCANNCGFFGTPATLNLCSKCYCDHQINEQQPQEPESNAKKIAKQILSVSAAESTAAPKTEKSEITAVPAGSDGVGRRRCGACGKRVGLIGFKCKCEAVFCGVHRLPEMHACEFDFKRVGKEAIAKANPVVKAEKLDRI